MNREEASFILANIDRRVCDDELSEALDMAIKALEQETVTEFADRCRECGAKYGKLLKQEPKFIAKSDGTIEQIKNCDDCLYKKEWEKIGKLISVVLEKQAEQEPKTGHWIESEMSIDGIDGIKVIGNTCSECKYYFAYTVKFNYCPNCGCRMIDPQESEERDE